MYSCSFVLFVLTATLHAVQSFRPGNETGLTRRDHVLKIRDGQNFFRFKGILRGSLFFDLNFIEDNRTVFNLRAFPWGDVDYEGQEVIDMWSSNETQLQEESITKRNAGPALPNLPIRPSQERIDIRLRLAKNFYGNSDEILMFLGNSLHWRQTLPRKFNLEQIILSEAVPINSEEKSNIMPRASTRSLKIANEATRQDLLPFGPPLTKYQPRDAIWGMTPLQVNPGDRYQLQIKGEVLTKDLPVPLEFETVLLTNYSSFRVMFDEPYLAKIQFGVVNKTKAFLALLHRETMNGPELIGSVDEKELPEKVTDHSFQLTFQRDFDKVAVFVDFNGVRLEGAMLVKDALDILPAHMLTIRVGKPEEHWLAVTEVSEKYL